MKSRNVRCERHVAHMDKIRNANKIFLGRFKKKGMIPVRKKMPNLSIINGLAYLFTTTVF
jgi:hypothetical protein